MAREETITETDSLPSDEILRHKYKILTRSSLFQKPKNFSSNKPSLKYEKTREPLLSTIQEESRNHYTDSTGSRVCNIDRSTNKRLEKTSIEVMKSINKLKSANFNNIDNNTKFHHKEQPKQKSNFRTALKHDQTSKPKKNKQCPNIEETIELFSKRINGKISKLHVKKEEVPLSEMKSINLLKKLADNTSEIFKEYNCDYVNSKDILSNYLFQTLTKQFYHISFLSSDASDENPDRFSDLDLSMDEDELISKPISSGDVELTSGETNDMISREKPLCSLSVIQEESIFHASGNVSLASSGSKEVSKYSDNRSRAGSSSISLVSSKKNGSLRSSNGSNNYTSAKSGRSSLVSGSSNGGRSSRGRCFSEKNSEVLECLSKLQNVSLNKSGDVERSETTTPTLPRNSNAKNDNKEGNRFLQIKKKNVPVKVSKNEVPLSGMKSFQLLSDMANSTMDILLKDHFNYLNENQAFFEMCPGLLAKYMPQSVDFKSVDKSNSGSKILDGRSMDEQSHSKSASVLFIPN
uniref:Non-specific serine/threonine protein kinase n=1 Tax=Strongyloides papillosus TaxID=174720 RepID=A0A0N5BCY1_STREA